MKYILFFGLYASLVWAEPSDWWQLGQATVAKNQYIAAQKQPAKAKNIILFIGDGMSIPTLTAARILDGQLRGETGEENQLFFERFPHLALVKTYNTNQQTPDSAGTISAIITGVKTKAGVLSVNEKVIRGDCRTLAGNEMMSFLELAEISGKSTGVVSTARITHATPAATYAHTVERDFESDTQAKHLSHAQGCVDIARQLIELPQRWPQYPQINGLEVALGGGRRYFLNQDELDPEYQKPGKRQDGRHLIQEWRRYPRSAYVWNQQQFDAIDPAEVDHLLGLFEYSHMQYELDRPHDRAGEPSLRQMTAKAIQILSKNPRGFFLLVESGRIDHAHHATNPKRALWETIELAQAVKTAYELTDPQQTLILVTADHSHTLSIAGYPTRGNPILGKVVRNDASGRPQKQPALAEDGLPYTTLGYANGRGFHQIENSHSADLIYRQPITAGQRSDLSQIDTEADGFHSEALVPLSAETHGGDDVVLYATGPGSALVNGLIEQNVIFHIMRAVLD